MIMTLIVCARRGTHAVTPTKTSWVPTWTLVSCTADVSIVLELNVLVLHSCSMTRVSLVLKWLLVVWGTVLNTERQSNVPKTKTGDHMSHRVARRLFRLHLSCQVGIINFNRSLELGDIGTQDVTLFCMACTVQFSHSACFLVLVLSLGRVFVWNLQRSLKPGTQLTQSVDFWRAFVLVSCVCVDTRPLAFCVSCVPALSVLTSFVMGLLYFGRHFLLRSKNLFRHYYDTNGCCHNLQHLPRVRIWRV